MTIWVKPMIDKIKVVAFCHRTSKNPLADALGRMPQYVADELGGECQCYSANILRAWTVVLSHASDIHVLVVDDDNNSWRGLCKWYRWLNPAGRVVSLHKVGELLLHEEKYSAEWTDGTYRLWVNRVLLPQIGFEPLAEVWEKCI